MKIFTSLYDTVLRWSKHPHAERYLAAVSFAEASFFPVPTVFMMAPMALARPARAWWLAAFTTIFSVLGGVAGYFIGAYLFDAVGLPIIDFYHAADKFEQLKLWFDEYGVLLLFIAGVSPIPYKLFTISAGVLNMALIPFVLASLLGRSVQYFVVAAIAYFGGDKLESSLRKWVDWLGWGIVIVAVLAFWYFKH
ncbi:MAG: DedA family protein [Proteobacteria bacterium]|nr:DedA family protein [Pseudomonadota bacterium]